MNSISSVPAEIQAASMPSSGTLPILQAGGFSASVDAYAGEGAPEASSHELRLWFLSLLGPQQAVKALWARLVKGEAATLTFEARAQVQFCRLAPEGPRSWRFFTASLPAAAGYHGMLIPEVALYTTERHDFLLLPREQGDSAVLHYRFLNRRMDLPLHPSWAAWLWERALQTGEAALLDGYGLEAYRCAPDPEALAEDLTASIRDGALALPR